MQVLSGLDRRRARGGTRREAASWRRLATAEAGALEEVVECHVDAAFRVAQMIVHDVERTADVLLAAFVALPARARTGPVRPVRVELLDAVRRLAAGVVAEHPLALVTPGPACRPDEFARQLPAEIRDVLALAIGGRCPCEEIASIMGIDVATVRGDINMGLREAATRLVRHRPH